MKPLSPSFSGLVAMAGAQFEQNTCFFTHFQQNPIMLGAEAKRK